MVMQKLLETLSINAKTQYFTLFTQQKKRFCVFIKVRFLRSSQFIHLISANWNLFSMKKRFRKKAPYHRLPCYLIRTQVHFFISSFVIFCLDLWMFLYFYFFILGRQLVEITYLEIA